MTNTGIDDNLLPLLGEFAWHSLTLDPTIDDVSAAHYEVLHEILQQHHGQLDADLRILEVASYAHTTGYQLHERLKVSVELFDISASTLRLGRRIAQEKGLPVDGTTRTAGDFHQLPYEDAQFDMVYICSALHHTWRWQQVLCEMIRVLAPGGILFLENEPCKREFCLNKFRTNRSDAFTPFEKKLEELGIIRTIAEPYLGSRPETLFGMVENQTIPLQKMLDTVASQCSVVALTVQPEVCMGPLEHEMVTRREHRADETSQWLTTKLTRLVDRVRDTLTDNDRGLGFDLPPPVEIESLCVDTAHIVSNLSLDSNSIEFRIGLSELFGAAVRLVARKTGTGTAAAAGRRKQNYPEIDEVVMGFPPDLARLLDRNRFLLPDIQTADNESIELHFGTSDWNLSVSHNHSRELIPISTLPRVHIPVPESGSLLVIVRMYVIFRGTPFRVVLSEGNHELESLAVFQAESRLLSHVIRCRAAKDVSISIKAVAIEGDEQPADSFRIQLMIALML